MFRTKRALATRRVAVAGAIVLLPLAALAGPAAADPVAPTPGYTEVDRDWDDDDRDWDDRRGRDRHRDRDRDWDRDDYRDRSHHRSHHGDRGWDDPARWLRHQLRGLFGSS